MSCACKEVRKIKNRSNISNSNIPFLTNKIFNWFIGLLNKIIVVLLFVIITPLVILGLIFNFIFKGKLFIKLPFKFKKSVKNIDLKNASLEVIPTRKNNKKAS